MSKPEDKAEKPQSSSTGQNPGDMDKKKRENKCAKLNAQLQEPTVAKDDLLWAYFCIKMINEVLGDKDARSKLKEKTKGGAKNMFELAILRELQKKE